MEECAQNQNDLNLRFLCVGRLMQSLLIERWKLFLRYLDLPGRRPARVYLHGLANASCSDFPRTAADPALSSNRSLLVDFLGYGYSDRPEDFGYTLEDHAGAVAGLLDHLGLTGCEIIGHSMGGSIAITLAALPGLGLETGCS